MFLYIILMFVIFVVYKWVVGDIDFVYGTYMSSSLKTDCKKDCIIDKNGFNSMKNKYDEKH